jgi:predicted phosphate transport protein (TIGR00153 family)
MGIKEWLIPAEDKYFDLFEKEAAVVVKGAHTMVKLTKDYAKLDDYAKKLDNLEHESDCVVHEIMSELNKTFITPMDREDICQLATKMDDIIDMIDATGRRLVIYSLYGECPKYLPEFASLILKGARQVEKCVKSLRSKKDFCNIETGCIKINDLENDGDRLLAKSLRELFALDDVKHIVKMKDIYYFMEDATDKCEEVANILNGIIIKEG